MVQGTRQRENTMTGAKAVLRLFMKIFWAISADCYAKSAFLIISTTFNSHKEWDGRKGKSEERALVSCIDAHRKNVIW